MKPKYLDERMSRRNYWKRELRKMKNGGKSFENGMFNILKWYKIRGKMKINQAIVRICEHLCWFPSTEPKNAKGRDHPKSHNHKIIGKET